MRLRRRCSSSFGIRTSYIRFRRRVGRWTESGDLLLLLPLHLASQLLVLLDLLLATQLRWGFTEVSIGELTIAFDIGQGFPHYHVLGQETLVSDQLV